MNLRSGAKVKVEQMEHYHHVGLANRFGTRRNDDTLKSLKKDEHFFDFYWNLRPSFLFPPPFKAKQGSGLVDKIVALWPSWLATWLVTRHTKSALVTNSLRGVVQLWQFNLLTISELLPGKTETKKRDQSPLDRAQIYFNPSKTKRHCSEGLSSAFWACVVCVWKSRLETNFICRPPPPEKRLFFL